MKNFIKKGFACLLAAAISMPLFVYTEKTDAADVTVSVRANPVIMPQTEIKQMTPVDENNAYIIFSDTAVQNKMSFEDGFGKTVREDLTYNEKVEWKGIVGRQVFYQNQMFIRFDPSFASPEDTTFKITLNYYDYGGAGYLHVDYTTPGSDTNYGRISVLKMGSPTIKEEEREEAGKWWEVTFYISDASFRQAMAYGGDLRICTGGYNTFAKIEVTNLSRTAGNTTFDIFNKKSANSLKVFNLFEEYTEETADAVLNEELTREKALKYMLQFAGLKEEAEKQKLSTSFTDVSAEYKPYVGMAESLGIVKNTTGTLGAKETFPQSELAVWYLNFLGVDDSAAFSNPLSSLAQYGLINAGNMVFQPAKNVITDNLVAMANNMLPIENLKTGKCYLSDLYNSGRITVDTFKETGDTTLLDWLMKGEFYMAPEEHYDEETGRTYYTINLLGEDAVKNYYTMPMTATDDKRFYFRDASSNIYEYNMETYMVKYICSGRRGAEHFFCVTKKNNLWYVDAKSRICKINLDTYEETVVVTLPDAYFDISLNTSFMLQVDFNETALTIASRDARYWDIRDTGGSVHYYDIENNIWLNYFVDDFAKNYVTDYTYPGHLCVNPVNKDLVFYCHEGGTGVDGYVNDRTWIMDITTGDRWVGFKQKKYSSKRAGESGVHEYWLCDGDYALTVRGASHADEIQYNFGAELYKENNSKSGNTKHSGIYFFRYDSKDRYLVNSDYRYSHCATTLNSNRWLISDVGVDSANGFTQLVLMDTEAGWSKVLANPTKGNNPGHTHPQFDWSGSKAFFGLWSEDYKTVEVGWMDISDITSNPTPGSQIPLNDHITTFSYEGMDSYMKEKSDEGGKYYEVQKDSYMNIKVDCDYLEKESTDIEVEITYLDNGYFPVKIDYCQWEKIITDPKKVNNFSDYYYEGIGKLSPEVHYIERNNSGKWKTAKVVLTNVNMENPYKLGADLLISGVKSTLGVRSVEVREIQ